MADDDTVTNETIAPLYLDRLQKTLAGYKVTTVVLPDGEAYKQWETLQLIFDGLLTARHDRKTTLIALGGGGAGNACHVVVLSQPIAGKAQFFGMLGIGIGGSAEKAMLLVSKNSMWLKMYWLTSK